MCSIMPSQYIIDKSFQNKIMKCVIQNSFLNSSHIRMHGGLYTQHYLKLNSFQFLYNLFFYHLLPFCISLYFLSFLMARVSGNLFKNHHFARYLLVHQQCTCNNDNTCVNTFFRPINSHALGVWHIHLPSISCSHMQGYI